MFLMCISSECRKGKRNPKDQCPKLKQLIFLVFTLTPIRRFSANVIFGLFDEEMYIVLHSNNIWGYANKFSFVEWCSYACKTSYQILNVNFMKMAFC